MTRQFPVKRPKAAALSYAVRGSGIGPRIIEDTPTERTPRNSPNAIHLSICSRLDFVWVETLVGAPGLSI